jgi:carbonic anhydrase
VELNRPASHRLRHHLPRSLPGVAREALRRCSGDLDDLAIADPHKAVAVDVAALKANPMLPGGFLVSGLVYDVATGRIELVVPPALLRPENPV